LEYESYEEDGKEFVSILMYESGVTVYDFFLTFYPLFASALFVLVSQVQVQT